MGQEPVRAHTGVLQRQRHPLAQRQCLAAGHGGIQPRGLIGLLLQRHHRRRRRQAAPRQVPPPRGIGGSASGRGIRPDGPHAGPRRGSPGVSGRHGPAHGLRGGRLLRAQHGLLRLAEAVCHNRRVHNSLRLRAAHTGGRRSLGHHAQQMDSAHDVPAHAVPLARQAPRRRFAHGPHRHGATRRGTTSRS